MNWFDRFINDVMLPEARGVATRDSGSGQVQSTKLDRTWVLLHFI